MSNPGEYDFTRPKAPTLEERLSEMQRQINTLRSRVFNTQEEVSVIIGKQARQEDQIRSLQMGMPKNGFKSSDREKYLHDEFGPAMPRQGVPVTGDDQKMILMLNSICNACSGAGMYNGQILIAPAVIDEIRMFLNHRGWRIE